MQDPSHCTRLNTVLMYFCNSGLVYTVGILWLEVLMDHIMPVVFSHHVTVQLEEKHSLVRLCQGSNDNRVWLG